MAKTKEDKKKVKAPKPLTDKQVFELADEYATASEKVKKFDALKKKVSFALCTELIRRKTKGITSDNGTTVTLVQAERVVYDPDGLWADLKPKQRREVFEDNINLNALTSEKRKEIVKLLTEDEREEITTHVLVVDKLSTAVQNEVVDAKVVRKHTTIEKNAPYVKISRGDSE